MCLNKVISLSLSCPKVILGPQMSSKDTTGSSELQIAEPSQCSIEISVPGPSHLDCTLQLCDIKADSAVPSHQPTDRVREHHAIVSAREASRNCKLCYKLFKKEMKSQFYCKFCDQSYCLNRRRNCMLKAHLTSPN